MPTISALLFADFAGLVQPQYKRDRQTDCQFVCVNKEFKANVEDIIGKQEEECFI